MDSARRPNTQIKREGSVRASGGPQPSSPPRIAHTLTACCRCRTRKTRCDPGLPRCGPCERTNSHCEYYDPAKGTRIPRNYVVHLQHKVQDLEQLLAELENDDLEPDPEDLMRGPAAIRVQESDETKYLGPSSGIAITRLVMQLAKQFTDSKSISEVVPHDRAQLIRDRFTKEDAKPTSKVYPLISDVAAEDLPNRDLTNQLVQLFYMKVQPMYPVFHEPSFSQDVEDVFNGDTDPQKNFCLRMIIAISLQKMDTQYAGLADSYYLAALKYFEGAMKPMDLRTLQCFALIAGYSLLTPTRTAVYYIVGIAVRLLQTLGLNEEKTITRGRNGQRADALEIDMRRRLFWIILTMDYGLAHSLGRASCYASTLEHLDVEFFETVDDVYISRDGIHPGAPPSLKKWIAMHFYKMRLLQLEIRRKLYQRKRPEPKDDNDPWFKQMEAKLIAWRDTSPNTDVGPAGLNKVWFIARFNTMVVFLFRPSPQVSRPSIRAATQCFDASQFNIHIQRKQIEMKVIDITWIFTQSLFMAINTILWSLSYSEVRDAHSREEVESHLKVGLEAISLASERWPGVSSAIGLYQNLIEACMKIYDKDGDIPIAASSPSDKESVTSSSIDGLARSRTQSPATMSGGSSLSTPPERPLAPFGYIGPQHPPTSITSSIVQPSLQQQSPIPKVESPTSQHSSPLHHTVHSTDQSPLAYFTLVSPTNFDPASQFNPLPASFPEINSWNPDFSFATPQNLYEMPPSVPPPYTPEYGDPNAYLPPVSPEAFYKNHLYPQWIPPERRGSGLNQAQQVELMQSLETEAGHIENMIQESYAVFGENPRIY